ncbi:hypothetical protein TB1_031069 [Malus domestica]
MTVLITGHRGLVGSAIILQAPYSRIQQPRTLDGLDLTRKAGVESLFTTKREAPTRHPHYRRRRWHSLLGGVDDWRSDCVWGPTC